ncbi:Phosphonoacetaldehyde hydrolase [Dyella sp. AD56]|uniref:HAD family hydrolase n=1 Tax=Dyella sp. AD56 TaxID=1528744 RepID=UPI000C838BDC|nr:HAD family hydrolase [Dyella sp. AD56]PMQ07443.1 Phosphonoacetaldehyde hydrolase [Dyella sp. AD56]
MTFELAVFDMAGTTVHDPDLVVQALGDALAQAGCNAAVPELRALMGYTKPAAIRSMLAAHDLPADDAQVALVHDDFVQRMLTCYRTHEAVRPMAGAEDTFAWLHERGIKVALNTAFSQDIAECLIERFDWRERGLIDAAISADRVPQGRPAPDMIRALMAECGVTDAARVFKVGDTEVDIREGRAAACGLVVAVTTGAYTRAELLTYRPDAVLDGLQELHALLDRSAPSRVA